MAYTIVGERDYLLANATHLRASLEKYRDQVKKFGAIDANIKKLDQAMQAVDVPGVDISPAQRACEEGRETLKESYRLFRDCARGVSSGIEGDDPAAAKALLVNQSFPDSDARLVSQCQTVAESFRKYGAKLTACGFGKDEQEHLKQSTATLEKLAAALRRDKTVRGIHQGARGLGRQAAPLHQVFARHGQARLSRPAAGRGLRPADEGETPEGRACTAGWPWQGERESGCRWRTR